MATGNALNANSAGLAKYDGAGTWSGVTLTQHAILIGSSSNGITSSLLTNGQLLIGNTGADPTAATLTAGTGISITNGAGSVIVAGLGGGLTWTVVTGTTQAAAVNNGYIANNAGQVVITLPAVSAVGDIIASTGINNATGWKIAQNAGNQIFFGTSSTASGTGGSLTSTATRDAVHLVCTSVNANWQVLSAIGNITIA